MGAEGSHTAAEWIALKEKQKNRCHYCSKKCKLTKDHVIPLVRGGSNYITNIVGACQPCNSKKHMKILPGSQVGIFDKGIHVQNQIQDG